jgi:hypothetical protein
MGLGMIDASTGIPASRCSDGRGAATNPRKIIKTSPRRNTVSRVTAAG